MTKYAEGTRVPLDRSISEITNQLMAAGCDEVATRQTRTELAIFFVLAGVAYRIAVPQPDPQDFERVKVNAQSTRARTESERAAVMAQEMARRARALAALVKARLIAVSEGITTIEREFFGNILVSADSGETMADVGLKSVARAIEAGTLPSAKCLPWGGK